MFVHIGKEKMIHIKDIILILDYEKIKNSPISQKFLKSCWEKGSVDKESAEEQNAKSVIVTAKKLYYSPIAVSTLSKRTLE
ncbi:extracellular matrix regulator RemB [Candidatus Formimonas warabiya]|uniref:DUF370 domain-containing protein n=1 Tax=Formimonas warabiya TaxID=1761012 RepID=A0A3G1KVK0_FORW1|nr:extracellular matrix/biofilm biosynthesis regulator RemA family protein [Candidatus Formimonas warabiya]ATW26409.1 hypothetical protein DCMF_18065 [Candidatus Formimonas warabiya]